MIKRLLSIILLLATFINIVFADVQQGYVRTIKRPGQKAVYLDNVLISVKGVNGNFKSKKGQFELELRKLGLKVGDPFVLSSVYKSGYELYDNSLSRVYSPNVPIEIVLKDIAQEAADQRKFADNMYKGALAQRDRKIKDLDRQLKQGKITEEQYREELQKFNDLFDKYQADINAIAKRYAGLDYENIDPVTEAINVAFSNGDFVLADSLLNTLGSIDGKIDANLKARSDIDAKIDFGTTIVEEGNNERKQNLQDAERLAELAYAKYMSFRNNFQNDSAAYYLEKRAELLPENVTCQFEAGSFLRDYMAQYQEALDYFNKALALALEQYGENHSDVATIYNEIGLVYAGQGYYALALEYYEKALKTWLEVFGENHPNVALGYNNIGLVYIDQGDYYPGMEFVEKALKIQLEFFGEKHPDVARSYNNIGGVYNRLGDYSMALDNYDKAREVWLEVFGENHPNVALSYNNIGGVYYHQEDHTRALENFEKALKIFLGIFGENHPNVASSYNNIGEVYSHQGDYLRALENHEKALKIFLGLFGENHTKVSTSYNNIGYVYFLQGDYIRALENLEKALIIDSGLFGENHPDVARSYNNIGSIYSDQGDYARALENLEKALKIWLEVFGENHRDVASSYFNIVVVYFRQEDYSQALEYYEEALKIRLSIFGENHPVVTALYQNMYETHLKLLESDKPKQNEFENFMADKVWTGIVMGEDSAAAKRGLNGEYVVFKLGDWDLDCQKNIFDVNKSLIGKPKYIVLYRDGEMLQHHFENQIGMQLSIKFVGAEKKKQIEEDYKKWVISK